MNLYEIIKKAGVISASILAIMSMVFFVDCTLDDHYRKVNSNGNY